MSFFTQKLEDSLNEPARISFLGPKYVVDLYRSSQRPVRLREGFPLKEFDGTAGGFKTIHDEFSAELQPRNSAETESKKLLLHILRYLEENPRPCIAFEDIYIIENGTCLALIKNPRPIKVISLPLPESDPEEDSLVVEEEEEEEGKVPADVSAPVVSDPRPVVVIEDAPVEENVVVDVSVEKDGPDVSISGVVIEDAPAEEEVSVDRPADVPSGVVIEDVPAEDQQADQVEVDASVSADPKEEVAENDVEKEEEQEPVEDEEKALEETEEELVEEEEEEENPVNKLKSIVVHVRKERKISISTASLMGVSAILYALFYTFAPHDLKT
eukprot:TRINITY_DN7939_c0_g1_i1.p1 TRINITY_DN7939_c0_g1~~TRINITY_DN7939_c0_g1_i1.p1  ORF type:complete len:370 (+),score=200.96 TRINITY_DN7939_c0_g1_i1:128-1111(+)